MSPPLRCACPRIYDFVGSQEKRFTTEKKRQNGKGGYGCSQKAIYKEGCSGLPMGPWLRQESRKLKGDERINQDRGPRNMVACTVQSWCLGHRLLPYMFRSQQLILLFQNINGSSSCKWKTMQDFMQKSEQHCNNNMGKPLDMPPLTKNPIETRILWKSNMHRRKVGASKSVKSSRARQRASAVRIRFYTLCYR